MPAPLAAILGAVVGFLVGICISYLKYGTDRCTQDFCKAFRASSCGAGHCGQHHALYCRDIMSGKFVCGDPRFERKNESFSVVKGGKQ